MMTAPRVLKTALWGFLTVVAIVVGLLFYTSARDVVELEYVSYKEALAAGAFTNASLPGFIPKSALKIKSSRDLDANVSLVTFDFGPDFERFLAQQKTDDVAAAVEPVKRHGLDFANPGELRYIPLLSSESDLYHGSLIINFVKGKALYVEPPLTPLRQARIDYSYFRDYDPQTGRHVQSDPIGLDGGINTYAYVEGDPVNYADPEGLVRGARGGFAASGQPRGQGRHRVSADKPPVSDQVPLPRSPQVNADQVDAIHWAVSTPLRIAEVAIQWRHS